MSKKHKKRKYYDNSKREFSKKVVISLNVLTWVVTLCNIIYMFIYKDNGIMHYLVPGMFTLTSTTMASYYWKAKNENQLKISHYLKESEEEYERTNYSNYGNGYRACGNGGIDTFNTVSQAEGGRTEA